ncbi:hypothetical protein NM208_g6067 [Fusarium decemcellulare]|uniref:Uncharacterized protein n=1 Tax=Fusarium decemcellulare TaxID=57161 RepID=A0ACC1SEP1_9HYPO|nr:hypothetical protein NM208_g6067 [Fusarium decemcellulare]
MSDNLFGRTSFNSDFDYLGNSGFDQVLTDFNLEGLLPDNDSWASRFEAQLIDSPSQDSSFANSHCQSETNSGSGTPALEQNPSLVNVSQPVIGLFGNAAPPPKIGARFSREAVRVLRQWVSAHSDHPFPSDQEKDVLQNRTGLNKTQILNWLANARRRGKIQARPLPGSPQCGQSPTSSTHAIDIPRRKPTPRRARSLATTTGLVIHAAADGIAMGASSTTSDMKLGFVIFVAIMIHKAPAAFGLTSLLLKQGLSKRAARGHLIVFSLAAPFGAVTTWIIITLLGGGKVESDHWWTGMLLLFSGGTFLYVAMHAMQEDSGAHGLGHGHDHGLNGYTEGNTPTQRKPKGPQMRDTLATIGGMLVPLLTQFGHHH